MKLNFERKREGDGGYTFSVSWALYWWDFAWALAIIAVIASA
jgi:hypothetical protein